MLIQRTPGQDPRASTIQDKGLREERRMLLRCPPLPDSPHSKAFSNPQCRCGLVDSIHDATVTAALAIIPSQAH